MTSVAGQGGGCGDESVMVVVKCRPLNARERSSLVDEIVRIDTKTAQCSISNPNDRTAYPKTFAFNGAFGPDTTNEQIYADAVFPLVNGVTEGYNGTVFAYGQTGCGKTYTIQGSSETQEQRGIVVRAFHHIFDTVAVAGSATKYLIRASYVEIYNEEIRDLLRNAGKTTPRFELKERPDGSVYVKDVSIHDVFSVGDCERLMERGWKQRSTGATLMNMGSSRSHAIFTIHVERWDETSALGTTDGSCSGVTSGQVRASKLNLVDLAGSERQSKSGAAGLRLREAAKINLSLSALGNVISSLVDGRSNHIPYRDSKLTRLLQDSLGGNTRTLMIACLSPAADSYEETLSTLRYANRAKNIRNRPTVNEDPKDAVIRQYLDEINRLKSMLREGMQSDLGSQRENQPMYLYPPVDLPSPPTTSVQTPICDHDAKIIEKIVHIEIPVVDEAQIAERTKLIAAEYEAKMRKLEVELIESRIGRRRTAEDIEAVRRESEENDRRARDHLAAIAEAESLAMRNEYENEMQRLRRELDSIRCSRDAVRAEADELREKFTAQLGCAQTDAPADADKRLDEENRHLVEEYERRMCRVQEELDVVKTSRLQVGEEMIRLETTYKAQIEALQLAVVEATRTAAVGQQEADVSARRRDDEDDEEDGDGAVSINTDGGSEPVGGKVQRPFEPVADVDTETVTRGSNVGVDEDNDVNDNENIASLVDNSTSVSPSSIVEFQSKADATTRRIDAEFDSSLRRLNGELDTLRQTRDGLANAISIVNSDYQEAIRIAQRECDPGYRLEAEQWTIKADAEIRMELIKDEVDKLRATRAIVLKELAEKREIRASYTAATETVGALVERSSIQLEEAVVRIVSAAGEYDDKSRELEVRTAEQKRTAHAELVEAKYVRDEARIRRAVCNGTITQQKASEMLKQCQESKAAELMSARHMAIHPSRRTLIVEDLGCDDDDDNDDDEDDRQLQQVLQDTALESSNQPVEPFLDRRRFVRSSVVPPKTVDRKPEAGKYVIEKRKLMTSEEAVRRLTELERTVIVGGGDGCGRRTPGGKILATHSANRQCSEIRKRLQQQKQHAEEIQYRLFREQQLMLADEPPLTTWIHQKESAEGGQIVSGGVDQPSISEMSRSIDCLRSKNKSLESEIKDLQCEFNSDRNDYTDTIRKQDQMLRWYKAVVDRIVPALGRGSNYADLDRVWYQSEWDDLNQTWIVPSFTVDRLITLPQITPPGHCRAAAPQSPPVYSNSRSLSVRVSAIEPSNNSEYSEDRLLLKITQSAQRDPATSYFRTGSRAEQLLSAASVDRSYTMMPYHHRAQQSRDDQNNPSSPHV